MSGNPVSSTSVAVPPVPEGAAVLHIGSPKTATSAIQYASDARREILAEHGVVYPKPRRKALSPHRHRDGVRSLRAFGEGRSEHPKVWDALVAQLDDAPGSRLLLSDEWASTLPRKSVEYAHRSLGAGSEIVFSVRNFGDFLVSLWQEDLRNGKIQLGLAEWIAGLDFRAKRQRGDGRVSIERQSDRLRRWVEVFGADKVNVLVVDKSRRDLVYEAFGALLDVSPDVLRPTTPAEQGPGSNRGLTAIEAAFVQRLLADADAAGQLDEVVTTLFEKRRLKQMQHRRTPPADELRLAMPLESVDRVTEFAQWQLKQFEDMGVRFLGDAGEFARRPQVMDSLEISQVPVDVATAVVLSALKGQDGAADQPQDQDPAQVDASE